MERPRVWQERGRTSAILGPIRPRDSLSREGDDGPKGGASVNVDTTVSAAEARRIAADAYQYLYPLTGAGAIAKASSLGHPAKVRAPEPHDRDEGDEAHDRHRE